MDMFNDPDKGTYWTLGTLNLGGAKTANSDAQLFCENLLKLRLDNNCTAMCFQDLYLVQDGGTIYFLNKINLLPQELRGLPTRDCQSLSSYVSHHMSGAACSHHRCRAPFLSHVVANIKIFDITISKCL